MFTGLIETVGTVVAATPRGAGRRMRVDLGPAAEGVRPGDSIALAGCCQTVTALAGREADFDTVAATLERTTLGAWMPGTRVNVERSLRPADRLAGHLVAGHVDGCGTVLDSGARAGGWWLKVEAPAALVPEIALRGSIAVDGVSLTVAETDEAAFAVALIPTTLAETTLGSLAPGDRLNLETDMLAKYVRRVLEALQGDSGADDARLAAALERSGFLES